MVQAVHYCHRKGVVHRDLKLENFLVDIDQETTNLIIKLTDFGLSKKIKPGHIRKGSAGTLATMAPEIINF